MAAHGLVDLHLVAHGALGPELLVHDREGHGGRGGQRGERQEVAAGASPRWRRSRAPRCRASRWISTAAKGSDGARRPGSRCRRSARPRWPAAFVRSLPAVLDEDGPDRAVVGAPVSPSAAAAQPRAVAGCPPGSRGRRPARDELGRRAPGRALALATRPPRVQLPPVHPALEPQQAEALAAPDAQRAGSHAQPAGVGHDLDRAPRSVSHEATRGPEAVAARAGRVDGGLVGTADGRAPVLEHGAALVPEEPAQLGGLGVSWPSVASSGVRPSGRP